MHALSVTRRPKPIVCSVSTLPLRALARTVVTFCTSLQKVHIEQQSVQGERLKQLEAVHEQLKTLQNK